jgi:hypothetical protein
MTDPRVQKDTGDAFESCLPFPAFTEREFEEECEAKWAGGQPVREFYAQARTSKRVCELNAVNCVAWCGHGF